MFKNPIVKNILSAVAVAVFGFILLNLAFMFDFLFQDVAKRIIKLFIPIDPDMAYGWFPPMMHVLFVFLIGLVSWFVFRSKLGTLYKAIYLPVPLAMVLATLGMFLYRWPVAAYSLGSLLGIGVLYYFYHTKQSWLYYYTVILHTVILIGLTMMLVGLAKFMRVG